MTRTRLTIDIDFGAWPRAIALHPRIQRADEKPQEIPSLILDGHPPSSVVLYMMMVLAVRAMEAAGIKVTETDLADTVVRIKEFNSPEALAAALSKQSLN